MDAGSTPAIRSQHPRFTNCGVLKREEKGNYEKDKNNSL